VAQGVFLTYKCWYKRIVAVPRRFFMVAQVAQVVGIASLFKEGAISTVAQTQIVHFTPFSCTLRAEVFYFF